MEISLNNSSRLVLLNESHVLEVFSLVDCNRFYLREWLPWVDGTKSIEDTRNFISYCKNRYETKLGLDFSILIENKIVGLISLHKIDWTNKTTSIGYWLATNYQKQGIMTLACKKLIDYCFAELNLNRIEIKCAPTNYRSQAIPKRLNFKHEGTLKEAEFINRTFSDLELFALVKSEWKYSEI